MKLGIVAGIASALWTIYIPDSPAKLVANISVAVENVVTITQEAKDFPLTRADVELLRAFLCAEIPEHEGC